MIASMKMGCDGFKDYWAFWNVVDWICISLGMLVVCIWYGCTVCMSNEALTELLNGQDLKVDPQTRTADQLDSMQDAFRNLKSMILGLHIVMAINTVSIVMKFFKAFTANARLKV